QIGLDRDVGCIRALDMQVAAGEHDLDRARLGRIGELGRGGGGVLGPRGGEEKRRAGGGEEEGSRQTMRMHEGWRLRIELGWIGLVRGRGENQSWASARR